ncbi:5-formyltetrahydrofolate cyclo-ligase [Acinetobacter sp. S40]|uniref:5-formyltetrahydrofolate cyclo-ligase n=1 Tax=unclassified Acinetobacter TaxID=196816 RepID=UPI00190AA726|nr:MULTISPECIES: 5-formyltetrahydrofolate cyclo-ligase [unclassified Acinetobacter]MBJ9986388.1 5-formyltetrahydrofolate cyclo-ligase [Acinetobacter sp. S40]MBK0063662.1 5-formyltetrahydrofolate cyclo-ligase [Acinetobacter sp. S55]MBK0067540.1 5-formyltetrahydrofolate cyclo-ligase [Acinetobacter sp. S54]
MKKNRKNLIQQRKQLTRFQQYRSSVSCHHLFRKILTSFKYQKIGLYLHAFGEVHTKLLIEECYRLNKDVFFPMICNMNNQLVWVNVSRTQYRNKRFSHHPLGMKEPMANRAHHVSYLDLLVMPLLACDYRGTRIGMGGGFYDRTLASAPHKPFRLGLAHSFQLLDQNLIRQPWDQPLDALLTPDRVYHFNRKAFHLSNSD